LRPHSRPHRSPRHPHRRGPHHARDPVALLPGAAGSDKQIKALQQDDVEVLIAGESREWETVPYVQDAAAEGRHKALILMGHEISEEAGMDECARWLRTIFPGMPIAFIPANEPFHTVPGSTALQH
jgi:putative NIF3 family GTP cyclohydrolase 1 type 2